MFQLGQGFNPLCPQNYYPQFQGQFIDKMPQNYAVDENMMNDSYQNVPQNSNYICNYNSLPSNEYQYPIGKMNADGPKMVSINAEQAAYNNHLYMLYNNQPFDYPNQANFSYFNNFDMMNNQTNFSRLQSNLHYSQIHTGSSPNCNPHLWNNYEMVSNAPMRTTTNFSKLNPNVVDYRSIASSDSLDRNTARSLGLSARTITDPNIPLKTEIYFANEKESLEVPFNVAPGYSRYSTPGIVYLPPRYKVCIYIAIVLLLLTIQVKITLKRREQKRVEESISADYVVIH